MKTRTESLHTPTTDTEALNHHLENRTTTSDHGKMLLTDALKLILLILRLLEKQDHEDTIVQTETSDKQTETSDNMTETSLD